MARYYVNTHPQSNGDHEVHVETCTRLPLPQHRLFLGVFDSCGPAVRAAKAIYPTADGCFYCCPACNTR
jgi:hypothetical protein